MLKDWYKIVSRICVREKNGKTPYKNGYELMIYRWLVDYRLLQERKKRLIKAYNLTELKK